MANVECREVTVTYAHKDGSETVAVDRFSYVFPSGAITAILGASGSGKSTLLRSIAGLNNFDGQIFVDGKDIEKVALRKRNIAYVSQTFDLYPHLTIYDNLAFPLKEKRLRPEVIDEQVMKMARELEILPTLNCKPRQLSVGQQQRVCLGRALLKKPDLLLFDEPLSNLDPLIKEDLCALFSNLIIKEGATAIYVTHDVKEAVSLGSRILVMENGRILNSFSKEGFLSCEFPSIVSLRKAGGIE